MIGRSIMRTASRTGGRIPERIPTTTLGRVQSQASQCTVLHSWCTFEIIPTKATIKKIKNQ